ncbi:MULTISPECIES: MFS transporter [Thalassospira]|uniref:Major facilitator transporter n=2 Tax=Thalassospira tepidiphila TaxID=393657 RepID=A0A853L113_9PROT|nr:MULTISPECIES: MFS transporter [Thalassospira]MBO6580387.1 MFS transporter [Thalassospira sp.]MBO6803718.1 MFS transporter [Thalassospira sp.]MBO6820364.1 MFS transporter [Thalassospira sp.]MBO6889959.1 MFS transporter [Thalassospira sp.]NJB75267.1 MFS family permease [Thalassospira tepidiphila]
MTSNLSPFSKPAFRHLFSAQITSLIGTGLTTVALSLLAYDLAGDDAGRVLGSILVLKMVAYLVIAPVAGGMAHLLPRRMWLVGLDVLRAGIVLCLPFVDQVWQIFVLVFVVNAASAAFTPVFQAIIPEILPDEKAYTKGLSYARLAYDLENLASPALAAALLVIWSFDSLFLANSLTFAISALLIMTAQIPQAAPTDRTGGIYANTVFGIVAYLKTPRLRGLLAVYFAVSSVGAMIIVNTVVLTRGILGGTELLTTSFLACAGAGSMCAAFLIPRLIERVGERHLMLAGIVAAAVAMLLGGVLMISDFASIFAFAILWLIAGAGTTFAQTPGGRLVQRSAGDGDRSAFFAANFALSHGGWLFAYGIVGWLGSLADLSVAFLASGGMAIGSVLVAVKLWPKEERLEIKHSHPGFWHEHPHDHNDPHHVHVHEEVAETDKHRHRHFHPPVTHKHRFVIDSHHTKWPMESGDRV